MKRAAARGFASGLCLDVAFNATSPFQVVDLFLVVCSILAPSWPPKFRETL